MHRRRELRHCFTWAALTPAVTLLLVGCGDDKPRTAALHTIVSATPGTSKASNTPAAAPSSARPKAQKAADGTRLTACADARCEVEMRAGDVIHFNSRARSKAGFRDLGVKSVSRNKVVYTMASGAATFTQPGPNKSANVNGISLTLIRVVGDRAVIRIAGPVRGALTVQVGPGGGMSVITPAG
ncbi:MAG: hypothetical protein J2P17_16330 [Mycobacterium sp.]|nr:hypothetical protein [Mycobacterium sp.]